MVLSLFAVLLLALTLGVLLFIRGRRGVVIDDHPICRRCGFDLFGRDDATTRCSECGADLQQAKAIRIGHRQPRAGLVWSGAALSLLSVIALAGMFWVSSGNVNWAAYKPLWLLIRETESVDAKSRDAALTEIVTRLAAGKLDDARILTLVDHALALQADTTKPWIPHWGDLIEDAKAAGKLPDDRWQKYALGALAFSLDVRPEVRRGDPIYYWIREGKARVGRRTNLWARYTNAEWHIDDVKIADHHGMSGGTGLDLNASSATGSSIDSGKFADSIADGRHTLKMSVNVEIYPGPNQRGEVIAETKVTISDTMTLLPADQPTVTVIKDPSHRAAIEKALKISYGPKLGEWQKGYLSCTIGVDGPPVGIGYEVFARWGGQEKKLGRFAAPAGKRNHGYGTGTEVGELTAEKIDLILRPSIDAAISTTDVFEIWDGEIVIRDLPVQYPATQPARR